MRTSRYTQPGFWMDQATEKLAPYSMRHLDVVSRKAMWAGTINKLIDAEAQMARAREMQLRLASHMVGRRTTAEKREQRELAAREERIAVSPHPERAGRSGRRVRTPRVFWHEGGQGDVVLLLNGWMTSGLVWPSGWLRRLEERFHVVRIDNRGTGFSRTAPAPYTMADLAEDAAQVLQAVGADRATVLGLSMGGMVAQELAFRHPEMVERLVLVASRPPSPAHLPIDGAMMLPLMARPDPNTTPEEHWRGIWGRFCAPGFADREPALLDELMVQFASRMTPRAAVSSQMRAIAGWYGADRLASISAPTVIVHGELDEISPVGNSMRLARLIPAARYVELPGVGHVVPLEAPDELERILTEGAQRSRTATRSRSRTSSRSRGA
jgi:pimeloyl-ACP methyl ester carboxylesterase